MMNGWFQKLKRLHRRNELEQGLQEEIQFHIEKQIEKNLKAGIQPDEARRQAMIQFGGIEQFKEYTRDEFRSAWLENLIRDLRHGARALLRTPGFTFVVIFTLALSIGAITAMFSVLNGIVLRPLPYPEQDRLIEIVHEAPRFGLNQLYASPAIYFSYRDHNETFDSIGLWDWDDSPVTVSGSGSPESIQSVEVTHEFLPILGGIPILGRTFSEADDRSGSQPTVIISYSYWQRKFGGADPLGQTLIVDGIPRVVIGVLPQNFQFFDYPADIFYPRQPVRSNAPFPSFDGRAIAKLKPGVTLQQANADVSRMIPMLEKEFGRTVKTWKEAGQFRPKLRLLKDSVVGNLDDTLWILMGTIGLLLLIACANVSNLVLVRTQSKHAELNIRRALGADSITVARVVFAENIILGVVGGALGLAIAYFSLPFLLLLGKTDLPQIMNIKIDPVVMLASLGISGITILLVALPSVLHFTRPQNQLAESLGAGGRSFTEGTQVNWVRQILLVTQVALAFVLLIGSALMIQTFTKLRKVDPGFSDPQHVLTFQLTIPISPEPESDESKLSERILRTQHAIVDQLASIPGVQSAAFSAYNDGLPLDGDGKQSGFCIEKKSQIQCADSMKEVQFVSPGFFETTKTPLVIGRFFDWNDVHQRRQVVLVSENFARAEWVSPQDALGKRISQDPKGPWREVVGVVKDVHHFSLSLPAPETVIVPAVATDTSSFVVRSDRIRNAYFLDEVRKAVWAVNANLSLAKVQTLGDLQRRSMARTDMTMQLLAITATIAFILGVVGIYGVVSYTISQRRREIGIRLALGAGQGQIRAMFVRRSLMNVIIGIAIGLVAAAGLTRMMMSQLFEVSPMDPFTYLAVAVLVILAAGFASFISALRASSFHPAEVLKSA
jgi:predicted permease